jgi:hypothetical protein
MVGMNVKTRAGTVVDVHPDEILRAAGVIYQARRKTHGHAPLHAFRCRWCNGEIRGRGPLDDHERSCDRRPSGELVGITADEMQAMVWPGPDAA